MKTKEEVLEQLYVSSQDLKILMPTLGNQNCLNIIKEIREEMEMKHLYVPKSKPLLAQTKLVRKKFGI